MTSVEMEEASRRNDTALKHFLKPLKPYLQREGLTELCVNRPGEIWTESSKGWERHEAPELTFNDLMNIAKLVATYTKQAISDENAILSATLPGGERCQVVIPPVARTGTVSLTIRKPTSADLSLDDYASSGAFDDCVENTQELSAAETQLLELKKNRQYKEFIELAVKTRQNIIVSGATGSGKTTFTKAIVRQVAADERLISIENVDELKLHRTHPNSVAMFYSAGGQGLSKSTPQQLMASSLRMKPDRIFLAEIINGDEAFYYMRNVNSGHPGSITTMHSNSPKMAIEQLVLFIKESKHGGTMSREDIKQLLYMCVDVIVQFKVVNRRRVVTEIYYDPIKKRQYID